MALHVLSCSTGPRCSISKTFRKRVGAIRTNFLQRVQLHLVGDMWLFFYVVSKPLAQPLCRPRVRLTRRSARSISAKCAWLVGFPFIAPLSHSSETHTHDYPNIPFPPPHTQSLRVMSCTSTSAM